MQACRYALEVVAKHPIYLLVYVGFLSLMGLFITSGVYPPATSAGYESAEVPFAVIDRDQSDLSRSVAAFLEERGTSVEVADEARACQDAVATGLVDYLLIVPAGFEEGYLAAARDGGDGPRLETVFSFQSMAATLVDTQVNQYLGLVRAAAVLEPDASPEALVAQAEASAQKEPRIEEVSVPGAAVGSEAFVFYLMWSAYPLTVAVVVSVGIHPCAGRSCLRAGGGARVRAHPAGHRVSAGTAGLRRECVEHRGQHHRHGADVSRRHVDQPGSYARGGARRGHLHAGVLARRGPARGSGRRDGVGGGRRRACGRRALAVRGGHLRYGARGGPDARDQRRRRRQCRGRCAEVAPWAPCRDRAARCAVVAVPRGTWDALSSRRPAFHLLRRGTCGTIRTRAFRRVICSVAWRSGSAGALQAQGRGFKSLRDHHELKQKAPGCLGLSCLPWHSPRPWDASAVEDATP